MSGELRNITGDLNFSVKETAILMANSKLLSVLDNQASVTLFWGGWFGGFLVNKRDVEVCTSSLAVLCVKVQYLGCTLHLMTFVQFTAFCQSLQTKNVLIDAITITIFSPKLFS